MAFCTFLHVARISSCSWTMQSKKQRTQSGISLHGNATTSRENRLANLLSRTKNAFLGARPPETNQSTNKKHEPVGVHTAQSTTDGSRHKQKRMGTSTLAFSLRAPLGWAPGRGRQLRAGVGPAWGMGASCANYYWHAPAWRGAHHCCSWTNPQ